MTGPLVGLGAVAMTGRLVGFGWCSDAAPWPRQCVATAAAVEQAACSCVCRQLLLTYGACFPVYVCVAVSVPMTFDVIVRPSGGRGCTSTSTCTCRYCMACWD